MRLNVYNNSLPGHANISFYEDGEHQYTIGANILHETTKLAFPQTLPFMPDDGIYRDESAYHLAELVADTVVWASVPLPEVTYDHLLNEARELENQTYNYSLLTEACVDLVAEFYERTGHPGEFGDLFAEDDRFGSLVWVRVPVSSNSLPELWPMDEPFYVPSDLIFVDKLEVIAPSTAAPPPIANDSIQSQKDRVEYDALSFDFQHPNTDEVKVVDAPPSVKPEPFLDLIQAAYEAGPKQDDSDFEGPQRVSTSQSESMDTPFEFSTKEDQFEFKSFDGPDASPSPHAHEGPPPSVEHKPSPVPVTVEVPKYDPESVFVDPDQYGIF
ncbi:hypothetical protein A8B78_21000 [Jannaschia sp. EhC01]|nr:hypothetical protein A8B78_21000 [Jannaschia sp. EhC01]